MQRPNRTFMILAVLMIIIFIIGLIMVIALAMTR